MDEADWASLYIGYMDDIRRKRIEAMRTTVESAQDCVACGNEIPSARQIALPGCQLCIECARYYEAKND